MNVPFITLTIAASGGLVERPLFVNATRIQSVAKAFERKPGHFGVVTQESYSEVGSWVCFGTMMDGDVQVVEPYDVVVARIREALS